jgi:hypothetical protein
MNCLQFAALLDRHRCESLPPAMRDTVTEHIDRCDDCSSAWRAVQELQMLREHRTPAPRYALFDESMQVAAIVCAHETAVPPRRLKRVGFGVALAASIVVAFFGIGLLVENGNTDSPASVAIALNETRDISVAIGSEKALPGVHIQVSLNGGIELQGFAGRNAISWTTDLDAGINKLTLPVSALSTQGGTLVVQVEHEGKRRDFEIRIDGDANGAATIGASG